jgi:poly-gamma-glutamate capsule biosynthesis protein CapA/YwtB (metallophosphatase superfamily)
MPDKERSERAKDADEVVVAVCGDVMTGRGIDQILPHPCHPRIHEDYVASALDYVELAEEANGPIARPAAFSYIWGDALAEFDRVRADARIVNLETSVTRSEDYEAKGINYRMSPENAPCLAAAHVDCCVLANNHVLDWGRAGLEETLATLGANKLKSVGAGRNLEEAAAPAILDVAGKGRILVFGFGSATSGIPRDWRATDRQSGVNLLADLSDRTVADIAERVRRVKRPGDVVVASIHWGGNWGYEISREESRFAHGLIDQAAVDIVHGHSSHHAKAIEVYRSKPILYGCGDFLNDYEGIRGHEEFRDDLALLYVVTLKMSTGELVRLEATPFRIRKFRLERASGEDATWLRDTLDREGARLGTGMTLGDGDRLRLRWA